MKTPPASLLCDPHTGKYLDFSGPRELLPLPGEDIPDIVTCPLRISIEGEEHCERVLRSLLGKPIAEQIDIEEEAEAQIPLPFDSEEDPEVIGWIRAEWQFKTR